MVKEELRTKEDKCLWEIYTRLFEASTPKGDFNELVENGKKDEHGRIHIPFMDYEIEPDVMDKIIQDTCKEFKIPKKDREKFKNTVYLGCSPRFTKEEKE
jgi:hypothetical protein